MTSRAVWALMPPSTSSMMSRPDASIHSRICAIFGSWLGRKDWPPKPGLTVITSTRSTSFITYSIADSWVAGQIDTPARLPSDLICAMARSRCGVASAWTVIISAPAFANSGMRSRFEIIKCTSSGRVVCGRMAFTTAGPMVRFGTKCPSITSTCTRSAPALVMAAISSPSRAKSAERIEGAMRMGWLMP